MPADILIYAIVAAGLVFWLRNILGTRSGDERERPNPFTAQENGAAPELAAPIAGGLGEQPEDINAGLERNMSIENEGAEKGLVDIARMDRSFVLPEFLGSAQGAFVMIIEAFAAGDKETLQPLLSSPVFTAFESVIDERKKNGEVASVEMNSG